MKNKGLLQFSLLILCTLFFLPSLRAQLIFNNGPYFNSVGTGAGGANESVLYTTTFAMGTIGFGHQATAFNRVADDFIVNNCAWRIDSIVFFGYQTGSTLTSTFTNVNFRIWNGIPNAVGSTIVFGDTTTNRLTRTVWSGAYRITETTTGNTARPIMRNVCALNNVNLNNGTYYLDWQSSGTLASGPWAPPRTPVGLAASGNGLQRTGSVWANAVDGGTGNPPQGFPFLIYGSILDPVANAGSDQTICPNAVLTLGGSPSGSGGRGTLTYDWNNGMTLNDSTVANPISSPTASTTYILAVTDTSGCTDYDTVNVTLGAIATQFLIDDTTICNNTTLTLDAGPAVTYIWSIGATTQTIVAGCGTYVAIVYDNSGCASTDTVVISCTQDVSIVGPSSICTGTATTFSTSIPNANTYLWNFGPTTPNIVVNQGGTYSVVVTDTNGCISGDTINVAALPTATGAFSFSVGGAGLSYTFSDMSTGAPTSWAWNFGDGGTSTQQNPVHVYATNGNYAVTLIVSNACGSDTIVQSLTVTGVEGSIAGAQIGLMPNPAKGMFTFEVNGLAMGDLHVEMVDLQGRVCQTWTFDDATSKISQQVDATKLAKGIYFMRFKSANLVETRKIVLE